LILTGFLHRLPLSDPLPDHEPVPVSGAIFVCLPDLPGRVLVTDESVSGAASELMTVVIVQVYPVRFLTVDSISPVGK